MEGDRSLGEQLSHLAQETVALELPRVGVASTPDDAGLHFALGDALPQEGRPGDAEAAFHRAVALVSDDWARPTSG